MQTRVIRVIHYLNQFFGGIGGENKADVGPQVRNGPTGPGRALQSALGGQGEVVATVICGDNYFAEKMETASEEVIQLLRSYRADVLIAGPAFDAGRYGIACGAVCKTAENKLGIPAVTGMFEENPGVDLFARNVYIVKTGETVAGMAEAISKMVGLALKLATNQDVGRPSEGGYFSRGLLVNMMAEKTGAERVVSMLLAKLKGEPFELEVTLPKYDRIEPAPRIKDIGSATIALVTDGGLVPKGNPDKIENRHATRFGAYSIDLVDRLKRDAYEVVHGGYDEVFVNEDPNRLLPVDVMRDLEKEGVIGKLHDRFYSTSGLASVVKSSEKMGKGIAEQLKAGGVSGVILTSTWGTSTRCGAALVRELDRAGIPSAHVCSITSVAQTLGSNRIIPAPRVGIPMGDRDLDPRAEKALRRAIVEGALESLQTEIKAQKLFPQHV